MTTDVAFSGAVAYSGVPHSPENICPRRFPLCRTFIELLGVPWTTKFAIGTGTTARKGAPDNTWQSVQWHTVTRDGSISALKVIAPQWQLPSICMMGLLVAGYISSTC